MIKLRELLMILDAKELRVTVPVTPRLKATIVVRADYPPHMDDLARLYGNHNVYRAEPYGVDGAMAIEVTL